MSDPNSRREKTTEADNETSSLNVQDTDFNSADSSSCTPDMSEEVAGQIKPVTNPLAKPLKLMEDDERSTAKFPKAQR